MATTSSPLATVEHDIVWIRAHVLMFFLGLALIVSLVYGGIYGIESLEIAHDAKTAAALQAKLGADATNQAALLSQLQAAQAANTVRDAEQTKLIQSLISQMAQQRAETAKQVATDATLTAADAANRLITQTKAAPGEVSVSGNIVSLDLPITQRVVENLDELQQAQTDVTNLQGQLGAQQTLTTDAKAEASQAQQVIAADKTELIATIKADTAACDVRVDAQAKKDLKRGFWASIAGFVGGVMVKAIF